MNTIQYIKIRARIAAVSINRYAFGADQHVYCIPQGNSCMQDQDRGMQDHRTRTFGYHMFLNLLKRYVLRLLAWLTKWAVQCAISWHFKRNLKRFSSLV